MQPFPPLGISYSFSDTLQGASNTDLLVGLFLLSSSQTQCFVKEMLSSLHTDDGMHDSPDVWRHVLEHKLSLDKYLSTKWRSQCLDLICSGRCESAGVDLDERVRNVFRTLQHATGNNQEDRQEDLTRKGWGASRSVTFEEERGSDDSRDASSSYNPGDSEWGGGEDAAQVIVMYKGRLNRYADELASIQLEKELDCARLVSQLGRASELVMSLQSQLESERARHSSEMASAKGLHEAVLNHIAQDTASALGAREAEEERLRGQLQLALRREGEWERLSTAHTSQVVKEVAATPRYGRVIAVDCRSDPTRQGVQRSPAASSFGIRGQGMTPRTHARPPSSLASALFPQGSE